MSDKTRELRALTGLRGIAALSVALGHYGVGDLADFLKILYWKNAAVDLFFCLSGFTLCVAYKAASAQRLPLRHYIGARIARIYPLFVIAPLLLGIVKGPGLLDNDCMRDVMIGDFVRQMLMVNAWPVIGTGVHWVFPAWSVSIEFFCYLFVFPPLFYAASLPLRLPGWARGLLSVAAMALSAFLFVRYLSNGMDLIPRWPGLKFPPDSLVFLVLRGALGMLAGWLAYASYISRDRFWRWAVRRADFIALAVPAFLVCGYLHLVPVQWMLVVFPVLVLAFTEETALSARLVASKPVHFLGEISYSIYLLHMPWLGFLAFFTGLINPFASHHPASFALLFFGLIPISALSYRFIEVPLRRLIRRAFDGGPGGGVVALRWALPLALVAVLLIQAQLANLMQPARVPPVALGEEVARAPTFAHAACSGWSTLEDWGAWSTGRRSVLEMPLAARPAANTKLALKGVFFVTDKHPSVTVHFSANGVPLETVTGTLAHSAIDQVLDLPPAVFATAERHLTLSIAIDNPASPSALGLSEDSRVLGFGLKSMMLVDGGGLP